MTTGSILLEPLATTHVRVRSAARVEVHTRTVKYKGFAIVARPYQLHDSKRWTVDLDLQRNGRRRSFSGQETCRTPLEAEARCLTMGQRIIDAGIPGWSVGQLRDEPRRWFTPRRWNLSWSGRPFLKVGAIAFGLAAFLLLEGAVFPSNGPAAPTSTFDTDSNEPHPAPLWMAGAGLLTGAGLVVIAARRPS